MENELTMDIEGIEWCVPSESVGYALKRRIELAWPYRTDVEHTCSFPGLVDRCRSDEAAAINLALKRFTHYATEALRSLNTPDHARGKRYERAADRELMSIANLPCHSIDALADDDESILGRPTDNI